MLTAVQGAAVGVAATAQASAKGVTSAFAEGASERSKVRHVGKAPPAEAKPILENAMAAYTVRYFLPRQSPLSRFPIDSLMVPCRPILTRLVQST